MASTITSETANDPKRFLNLETVVGGRMKTSRLKEQVIENGNTGQLNPMWVEWLMGYPMGWTDLKD
jgi:hypothetical protein